MRLLLLTAFNEAFADIGELAIGSINAYRDRCRGINTLPVTICGRGQGHPSWAKIGCIRANLPHYDYVQWIDADALILGQQDLRDLLKPATLNIAKDGNGINCGVMAWRNCPEAFAALDRMEKAYERFKDHPWFEQAALMEFVDELDVHYQEKRIYNAYQHDFCAETLIRHWPGEPNDVRLREMRALALEHGFGPAIL
jgi:hypothetical protein